MFYVLWQITLIRIKGRPEPKHDMSFLAEEGATTWIVCHIPVLTDCSTRAEISRRTMRINEE